MGDTRDGSWNSKDIADFIEWQEQQRVDDAKTALRARITRILSRGIVPITDSPGGALRRLSGLTRDEMLEIVSVLCEKNGVTSKHVSRELALTMYDAMLVAALFTADTERATWTPKAASERPV